MNKAPKSLVIKKMPRASVRGAQLRASTRKAIVAKALAASVPKIVTRLHRSDTATGAGRIRLVIKPGV